MVCSNKIPGLILPLKHQKTRRRAPQFKGVEIRLGKSMRIFPVLIFAAAAAELVSTHTKWNRVLNYRNWEEAGLVLITHFRSPPFTNRSCRSCENPTRPGRAKFNANYQLLLTKRSALMNL